ncbi:hypothetical protein ABT126_44670 [Streptomyces sp. NPDC002012]|uniref:hypothetical protein n=1 Tax=unclassified Streptomyces TaxID=2593676 RepID=UPI002E133924|nr:hypothetical protein OG609_45875 [Streptomyces sp. NBC_01224]
MHGGGQELDGIGLVRVPEQLVVADVERRRPRGDREPGDDGGLPPLQRGGETVGVLGGVPGLA